MHPFAWSLLPASGSDPHAPPPPARSLPHSLRHPPFASVTPPCTHSHRTHMQHCHRHDARTHRCMRACTASHSHGMHARAAIHRRRVASLTRSLPPPLPIPPPLLTFSLSLHALSLCALCVHCVCAVCPPPFSAHALPSTPLRSLRHSAPLPPPLHAAARRLCACASPHACMPIRADWVRAIIAFCCTAPPFCTAAPLRCCLGRCALRPPPRCAAPLRRVVPAHSAGSLAVLMIIRTAVVSLSSLCVRCVRGVCPSPAARLRPSLPPPLRPAAPIRPSAPLRSHCRRVARTPQSGRTAREWERGQRARSASFTALVAAARSAPSSLLLRPRRSSARRARAAAVTLARPDPTPCLRTPHAQRSEPHSQSRRQLGADSWADRPAAHSHCFFLVRIHGWRTIHLLSTLNFSRPLDCIHPQIGAEHESACDSLPACMRCTARAAGNSALRGGTRAQRPHRGALLPLCESTAGGARGLLGLLGLACSQALPKFSAFLPERHAFWCGKEILY